MIQELPPEESFLYKDPEVKVYSATVIGHNTDEAGVGMEIIQSFRGAYPGDEFWVRHASWCEHSVDRTIGPKLGEQYVVFIRYDLLNEGSQLLWVSSVAGENLALLKDRVKSVPGFIIAGLLSAVFTFWLLGMQLCNWHLRASNSFMCNLARCSFLACIIAWLLYEWLGYKGNIRLDLFLLLPLVGLSLFMLIALRVVRVDPSGHPRGADTDEGPGSKAEDVPQKYS